VQRGILVVTVKDNGVGISAFDQQHIFEQFYRSAPITPDGTVLDYRGAGLGLFIVDQVAKAHNGRVSVISEIGAGSEFVLEMPIAAV
jgi:signal transduction histidine kinase